MTDITRRALIGASAAGVVAGVVGTAPAQAAAPRPRPRRKPAKPVRRPLRKPVNLYSRSRFVPQRNATFVLSGEGGSATATLARVTDLPSATAGDDDCFGLTFTTATAGPPQGTYTLRRRGFTPTTLFVVPSDADRRTYQAVVYRAR